MPRKKYNVERPYCGGTYTEARTRSFVMQALRRARWPVKYQALREAFHSKKTNPKTGRLASHYICSGCGQLFPAKEIRVDHIEPVIPIGGRWGKTTEWLGYNWNELLPRLFCEQDNLQALHTQCHNMKSEREKNERQGIR